MLTLPIKKKWFDMIVSGEKKEEYREIKPYYESRFKGYWARPIRVKFRNGYNKNSLFVICDVIPIIGKGKPLWGAVEGVCYYVLKIQKIVEVEG